MPMIEQEIAVTVHAWLGSGFKVWFSDKECMWWMCLVFIYTDNYKLFVCVLLNISFYLLSSLYMITAEITNIAITMISHSM